MRLASPQDGDSTALSTALTKISGNGQGDNPLYVSQRYGLNGDGNVSVPVSMINLNALGDPDFTGDASGGSAGFGGVNTGFSHGGQVHGVLQA